MLVDGLPTEKRAEIDQILSSKESNLVAALIDEGVSPDVARLRDRISRASSIEEKARLRIEMMQTIAEEKAAADG